MWWEHWFCFGGGLFTCVLLCRLDFLKDSLDYHVQIILKTESIAT